MDMPSSSGTSDVHGDDGHFSLNGSTAGLPPNLLKKMKLRTKIKILTTTIK